MRRIQQALFFLLIFCFPLQLGKHFWINESLVLGRKIDFLSPTLFLTDIITMLFICSYWITNKNTTKARTTNVLLLSLLVMCMFLVSFSGLTPLSFYFGARLLTYGVLGLTIIRHKPTIKAIIVPLTLSLIPVVLLTLWQFLDQSSVGGAWYWLGERTFSASTPGIAQLVVGGRMLLRGYGTFSHPNVLGGFLVALLPFLFFQLATDKKHNTLYFTGLYTCLLGIFLSFSRAAWVVGAVVVIINLLKKRSYKQGVAWILLGVTVLIFVEEFFLGRFFQLFFIDGQSITERQKLFENATFLFMQSPLLGIGIGRFISGVAQFGYQPLLLQPVHSIYALIAAETGLIGLSLFLGACGLALYRSWQKNSPTLWALGALLLLGMIDHYPITLPQTQLLLVLLIAKSFV